MGYRVAPASIGQRLLWFLEHYRPDTASLNCPVVCRLHGPLDVGELQTAVDRLVARHEALRTTLVRDGRSLTQHVHDEARMALRCETVADPSDLDRAVAAELATPVDITAQPMRVTLWRVRDGEHMLCLNMHHLVSDAWSCGIVMQDLIKLLDAGRAGTPNLAPVGWQYADFAQWQDHQLSEGAFAAHREYWVNQLRGMKLVPLPKPAPSPEGGRRPSAVEVADIDRDVFGRLSAIARRERTTIFAVLLSLYYVLLQRETGQSDLSVASLFANRSRRELQTTVGFLANMVVLRSQIEAGASFAETVRTVRRTVVDAFLHEGIPFQMLPFKFQETEGRVDDVVFQVLLTPPPGTKVTARGVDFELYTPDTLGSRFGLELGLIPQHTGECKAMLFYTTDRFDRTRARALLDGYLTLAREVTA